MLFKGSVIFCLKVVFGKLNYISSSNIKVRQYETILKGNVLVIVKNQNCCLKNAKITVLINVDQLYKINTVIFYDMIWLCVITRGFVLQTCVFTCGNETMFINVPHRPLNTLGNCPLLFPQMSVHKALTKHYLVLSATKFPSLLSFTFL